MADAALRLLLVLAGLAAAAARGGPTVAEPRLLGLDGRPVAVLPGAGETTVFVFTATDCPIANRYAPELRRIHDRFAGAGVRFWLVYVDPRQAPDEVRRHSEAFATGFAPLLDPDRDLVRLAGARVTPEAAVFVGGPEGPRLVYRGRIDDRNVAFGQTRPAPKSHDLEDALLAIEAGGSVTVRTTTAVGCTIPPLE